MKIILRITSLNSGTIFLDNKNMKVLIVGSGGREHAIATSVKKSPKVSKIYCAPGNAGIGQIAQCVPIGAMEFDALVKFAKETAIDFVIVGMDDPLVGGLVDAMEEALRLGNSRVFNIIVLGVAARHMDFTREAWLEVIEKTVPPKTVEINKRAFLLGFEG